MRRTGAVLKLAQLASGPRTCIIVPVSISVFSRDILKGGNNIGVRAGGRGVLGV